MTDNPIKLALLVGAPALILAVAALMFVLPQYSVWEQGLAGESELRRAEWNRQIAIQEAQAKEQAAEMLARAEVARARGVAEANTIIGESLKGNEAYLRWLWIDGLKETTNEQVIYIPTEAGIPILEAGKR